MTRAVDGIIRQPPIVIGSREQLFHLLAEAAEIEHTLMCSYLYAAFSLKRVGDPGLDDRQAKKVAEWRKAIMTVAVDEMVHLVNVANLTIAIGGRPHFGRPNFPVEPGYFPSGVVVRLTPFSPETLEHFIHLERPQGVAGIDAASFQDKADYRREEAYHGLMPSVQDYASVGRLYEAILLNLRSATRRLGEDALFVGPVAGQVGSTLVKLEGVTRIADLASAVEAIATIVEQGEGSPGEREGSHYHRFLSVRDEYRSELARDPGFAPAWPSAANPVMRRPTDLDDKVFVDDPAAARLLDLGNAIYSLLLRLLVQAFGRSGPNVADEQRQLLEAAFGLMGVVGRIGHALAKMPAGGRDTLVNAGMTFTMLRGIEPMFAGRVETSLLLERFDEVGGGVRAAASTLSDLRDLPEQLEKARIALGVRGTET